VVRVGGAWVSVGRTWGHSRWFRCQGMGMSQERLKSCISESSVLGLLYVADQYTAGNFRVRRTWGQDREFQGSGYNARGQDRGFRIMVIDLRVCISENSVLGLLYIVTNTQLEISG
jgi:hypothetical protein